MGLGKSLSMLALIASDKNQGGTATEPRKYYSTLIVVPPQRMQNYHSTPFESFSILFSNISRASSRQLGTRDRKVGQEPKFVFDP